MFAGHTRQRAAERNVQGRRAPQARPRRHLRGRFDFDPAARLEEHDQFAQQRQLRRPQSQIHQRLVSLAHLLVLGDENDPSVGPRGDFAGGVTPDGEVDRLRPGMKQVERPDVYRAAGEVHSGGCAGFHFHEKLSGKWLVASDKSQGIAPWSFVLLSFVLRLLPRTSDQ